MKKIYRLLVILMGAMIFLAVYLLVRSDNYSNLPTPQSTPSHSSDAQTQALPR